MISSLILVGFLTSCNVTRKYTDEASKRWESDIRKFEQLDKSAIDPDNAILFAGSSSIRLWSTLREDVTPYPVIQRGFGGSKFSDLAVYAKRIVYPHQFRALVIFEANDITGIAADKSPEEVVKLFRNYLNKDGEPRQELFIKDMLHQNREGYIIWGDLVRKKLDEVLARTPKK